MDTGICSAKNSIHNSTNTTETRFQQTADWSACARRDTACAHTHLHSDALDTLLLIRVHDVGHVPGLTILILCFALILFNSALVDTPSEV